MSVRNANQYASSEWKEYRDNVRSQAFGNWDSVFAALAPALAPALARFGKHVACPRHGGTDGFRFFSDGRLKGAAICNTCGTFDDGFNLLMWLYGWTFGQTLQQVGDVVGVQHPNDRRRGVTKPAAVVTRLPAPPQRSPEEVARLDEQYGSRLNEAWEQSVPLTHPDAVIGRAYLRNRGITEAMGPLADLRVHPGMPYFEQNVNLGVFPTLLAMLRQPNGEPCTIHRVYLAPDGSGKAAVDAPKKVMPRRSTAQYMGSAVRLDHQVGSVLLAAEGTETALAVRAMMGLPTWAGTVAGLMEGMVIEPQVRLMVIFGDKDRPQTSGPAGRGYVASTVLAERLQQDGRKVSIYLPPFSIPEGSKKLDWLDVLERFGLEQCRQMPMIVNARAAIAQELANLGLQWESANAHF